MRHRPGLPTPAAPDRHSAAATAGALAALLALLAGCASTPPPAGPGASGPGASGPASPPLPRPAPHATDGPPADPPPDLAQQPDPEPRVEPLGSGGPNKPYELFGERYVPLAGDVPFEQTGLASWYGRKFHGRRTANGEVFDMYALSAAHPTLPLPSYALVRNPRNGREIVVRVNDRGPFGGDRIVDLSYAAAVKLGVERGVAPVQLRRLTHDEIRTGRWRGGGMAVATTTATTRPNDPELGAPVGQVGQTAPGAATASPGAQAPLPAPASVAATATATSVTAPAAAPTSAPAPAQRIAASPVAGNPAEATPALVSTSAAGPVAAGPGTSGPAATATPRGGGFWVQLGAFARHEGALDLRTQLVRELAWLEQALTVRSDRRLYRVQAGPYPTQAEAAGVAERIRDALQSLQPLVLPPR